jgi:predicted RNase H-like HicB family nuclease
MKLPEKYIFPALFIYEQGEKIAVVFPDIGGCTTCGKDEQEAFKRAKECLGGHLHCLELDGDEIPSPSELKDINTAENEKVALIEVYMPAIRMAAKTSSVNRMVTLPAWLNYKALEQGINFSQVLQNALIKDFGLNH